ncbi:MAG TPA: DNA primase [Candidatus Enterocloster excrementipullorum]|uniref:DNA primase n=1 Tax=Candidatus Enterocloster excrementipullorum TaxID=2838559 RepID=A0A9D2N087_9FIRM|nr:DNA primase [Candidatus Enterocloster excrementipullorum]
MYYPEEVIEEVRMKNDIVDVVSGYVKLQKKGANYFGLCPFHNEKSPSFSVSPGKQMYYCFGCGAGGNVFTFLMEYENYTFQEALQSLADRAGVALPKMEYGKEAREQAEFRARLLEVNKLAANYFYHQLKSAQGQLGYRYLHEKRRLSDQIIVRFGLGYSNKTSDDLYRFLKEKGYEDAFLKETGLVTVEERGGRDKFWNRVMFPIMDVNNRVIGFGGRVMGDGEPKYLNSPETKIFDKSRSLYGLNYARTSREKYMLVCEGYLDVISLHQAGFSNAVASLGTAFTSQHAGILKRYTDQVILTYDSDGAGVKAALRAIPILREAGISSRVLNMKPYKDPDEFIGNLGADAFRQRIEEAKNSFLFEIDVLKAGYSMDDPEQKTRFYQETAKKLLQFGEPLERDNYLEAVAREHMIPKEELRRLVNHMGMSLGLRAGEGLRENIRGRRGEDAPRFGGGTRSQGERRAAAEEDRENGAGNAPYAGESAPAGPERRRKSRAQAREDGIRRSQRLLLTWLIEDESLFGKIEGILTPDDFTEELYRQVAQEVFEGHRSGTINPADILSRYINDEDQYKEVAALFNASLGDALDSAEQKKAFSDTVLKVKKYSLDAASRNAKDIAQLQEIIKQQAALKTLRIPMD